MKTRVQLFLLLVTVGVFYVLVAPASNSAATASPHALTAAAAPSPAPQPAGEPHLQVALASLKNASAELKLAPSDKGGYRAAAVRSTQDALQHTQEAINYMRTHP